MEKNNSIFNETYKTSVNTLKEAVKTNHFDNSIYSSLKFIKDFFEPEKDFEEKLRNLGFSKLQVFSLMTRYTMYMNNEEYISLPVINPVDFDITQLPSIEWAVKDMMPDGVSILAAPPKYHKSFFALQLAVSVCSGMTFLGFETVQGDVIYFDMESGPRRSLNRLLSMYSTLDIDGLHIITAQSEVRRLEEGFEETLEMLLVEYPNTRLVIIDVLQHITPVRAKDNTYSSDYDIINQLNKIATKFKISILAVHHTRKLRDEMDPVNNITGTTGLTGAVSTIMEIIKENRVSPSAILLLTGNDIETREISIRFDKNNLRWIYEGDAADIAFKRFVHLPETQTIIHMMEHCSTWSGTAADLSNYASSLEYEIKPPDFGQYIKFNISNLSQLGFIVTQNRTYDTRKITITRHVEKSPS